MGTIIKGYPAVLSEVESRLARETLVGISRRRLEHMQSRLLREWDRRWDDLPDVELHFLPTGPTLFYKESKRDRAKRKRVISAPIGAVLVADMSEIALAARAPETRWPTRDPEADDADATAKIRVRPPPGHHLLALAELFFSRSAYENVLLHAVNDMRSEYNQALFAGRHRKAMLIRIRGTWAFLKAAGLLKALGMVKFVARIWTAI